MRMETKMQWYNRKGESVLAYLETDSGGLTGTEVARRLEHFGPNSLPKPKQESYFTIFARQFANPLIYLLLLAAGVVVLMGEFVDGSIIALVLILNAIIGSIQEGRAVKTLVSLQKLVTTKATVLRDNKEIVVNDAELVPGDIVILREGEKVPADCRILEQTSLKVNESAITGESVSVEKHSDVVGEKNSSLPLPDQKNMLFLGTLITSGNARAVVIATGLQTVMGSISGSIQHIQREIPLQRNIRHLANILILVVLSCSIILFFAGLYRGMEMREIFGTVVSLAVSIIPEGLPIAVTLILASGVWRMSKRNALVKKLQAIEALGQVDIIAVDKTGTITQNEMTVVEVAVGNQRYSFSGTGYEESGGVLLDNVHITPAEYPELLVAGKVFALCANARISKDEETGQVLVAGDPTDAALVIVAQKIGFVRDELLIQHPLVEELPFDYKRKFHATVHQLGKNYFLSAIGALDAILPLCEKIERRSVLLHAHAASKKGLRVLAFAYSEKAKPSSADDLPRLTFGGLVTMLDPLQPEVAEAVAQLRQAGIRVAMLTGDNALTAKAIAESAGIYTSGDQTITSSELYKLSDKQLYESLHTTTVFARVTPDDKLKLIEYYGNQKLIAGMTGDGVNDAPALLAADIGMAMGKKGTEVAKEAADIVLLDDNFTTIVAAVEEGRNIYLTIKKVLLYLFSTSLGELLAVSASVFMGLPLPVIAVQIIWLNFVTDGFLTVALGMEPKEQGLLNKVFKPGKYLLSKHDIGRMVVMGVTMATVTLYLFTTHPGNLIYRQTIALTVLAVVQWFNAWNARTEKSIFVSRPWRNPWLALATITVIILQILAVYWPPFQTILKTTALTTSDWLLILLCALSIFVVDECYKLFRKMFLC